ncbi:MAG: polysaccharide lyase [Bdellovibrionales bacterium]|nr:polysaccharide lyase [Bdellovibrionales bacterium]
MKSKILINSILVSSLLILFQNCSQKGFNASTQMQSTSASETTNQQDNPDNSECVNNCNDSTNNDDTNVSDGNTAPPPSSKGIIFHDNFESADLLTTNSDGFEWLNTNRTSIVNSDQYVVWNGSLINNGPIANRQWEGYNGDHSMRFRYPANQYMAEQRFSLGKPYKDLWIYFALRVPINFKHGTNSPTNSKLFAIWMDGYSNKGDGSTVIWEYWNSGDGGSNVTVHYSPGGGGSAGGHIQSTPFIKYPEDQGRWMEIILHVKASSKNGVNDGLVELYNRKDGEKTFTQIHLLENIQLNYPPTGEPQGWAKGYLMGWSNPSFSEDTEWLMDDFTVSTSSLLPQ